MVNQEKTKILYIITKSVWGGASKYVYDLATGLPKDEFDVFVAAGGNGEMAQKLKTANISYFNIKNFRRDLSFLKDIFAYFELFWLFLKIKPDIIHTNSSKAAGIVSVASFIYSFYSLLITRYSLLKVFTVHGWAFHENRSDWQISLIKLFSKITCIFYNKIICVSEFDKKSALKNKIVSARKLTTIHNGIKLEDYNFLPREEARNRIMNKELRIKNADELWIGTIGEDTKNKGHKYLKKAVKNAIIIKDLSQGYNYLKAFDIFILPSIKEGFPYILLEAGLARLPVIATNVGGVPEIIENEETGLLVKPKNTQELKEATEKLLNDPELRSTLSFALWEKITREFTFEKMLNATIAVYRENSNTSKKRQT